MALLDVDNLTIAYHTRAGQTVAVEGASFALESGRSLGIVGESGCGKTTLGMGLLRLLPSNAAIKTGSINFEGENLLELPEARMRKLRWKKISMIFQAAMNALNPVHRVGDQIMEAIRLHSPQTTRSQALEKVKSLYSMVGISRDRIFDYPHQYSGGMKQRAVIAMALACEPDMVIADEPTTAVDVIVQDQIIKKIIQIQKERNIAVLFISHDIGVVAEVCHDIMVMYNGRIVEAGTRQEVFHTPVHPYTRALLSSYLTIDGVFEVPEAETMPECHPADELAPEVCGYVRICPQATEICRKSGPIWRKISETHGALCTLCTGEEGTK